MKPNYQILSPCLGELFWPASPSDELLSYQLAYLNYVQTSFKDSLVEVRQGFTRVSLIWKNLTHQQNFIRLLEDVLLEPVVLPTKIWLVPVCYDSNYGQDLIQLAEIKNMNPMELIRLHSEPRYRIHFFGFLPGFFYLNGLDSLLHTPRKSIPSPAVAPGSVAIGGSQTGIYPMQSPGGWHIIGRSPLTLFDTTQPTPVWAKPGEQIQFVPISSSQFDNWKEPLPKSVQK